MVEGAIKFYPQRACDDSFILQPMAIIKTLPSTPYKYQSLYLTLFPYRPPNGLTMSRAGRAQRAKAGSIALSDRTLRTGSIAYLPQRHQAQAKNTPSATRLLAPEKPESAKR